MGLEVKSKGFKEPIRKAQAIGLMLLFSCSTSFAQSEEKEPSIFSFSGFGTVGVVHSSEEKADFVANDFQAHGAGHSRAWSPDVDSILGAQVTANFTPEFSGVVQVVAEQRYDGTYRPAFEWANLKYEFTPDFNIRVGRIVLPSLLVSDYRKVGYATPWVRPPNEVYSLVPVTNSDGIDMTYRLRMGEMTHTLQVGYGEANAHTTIGSKAYFKQGWLISDTAEYGAATLHATYIKGRFTVKAYEEMLFNYYTAFAQNPAVRAFAPQAAAQAVDIVEEYNPDNKPIDFIGLGAGYDPGNWFVQAEWAQLDSNSILGKRAAWYATSGYRWGNFTPYVTYAVAKLKSNSSDPGITAIPSSPMFAQMRATANALNKALDDTLTLAPVQKTVSVGIRWDFARNAALKLQYDHSNIGNGSPGTLSNYQPGFERGRQFELLSASINFVF